MRRFKEKVKWMLHLTILYFMPSVSSITSLKPKNERGNVRESCHADANYDWLYFQSWCFLYIKKPSSFAGARQYCGALEGGNAEVVSIYNQYENELLQRDVTKHTNRNFWIGVSRASHNKTYWYVDPDSPHNYSNWLWEDQHKRGLCTVMLPNGYWFSVDCSQQLSFVCKKRAIVEREYENFRIVIITCVPSTIVILCMLIFMAMINRSKREIKALYKRFSMKKNPEMFVDNAHIPIPKKKTFDITSLDLSAFLAVQAKYQARAAQSDTKDRNSEGFFIENDKSVNVPKIMLPFQEVSSNKGIGKDNNIFYIHDEVGRNIARNVSDSSMSNASPQNDDSISVASDRDNFISYTQDIKIVLEDETLSSTSSKENEEKFEEIDKDDFVTDYYSSNEHYPHSLTTESARNSVNGSINLSWFSESMRDSLFEKLGIKSNQPSPNETSLDTYSIKETEDGFVEVSL